MWGAGLGSGDGQGEGELLGRRPLKDLSGKRGGPQGHGLFGSSKIVKAKIQW